jgi:hypothetical protein
MVRSGLNSEPACLPEIVARTVRVMRRCPTAKNLTPSQDYGSLKTGQDSIVLLFKPLDGPLVGRDVRLVKKRNQGNYGIQWHSVSDHEKTTDVLSMGHIAARGGSRTIEAMKKAQLILKYLYFQQS